MTLTGYGLPSLSGGGIAASGAAAAAAGNSPWGTLGGVGSLGGLPWNIILPIAISLIQSLVSGKKDTPQYKGEEMKAALDAMGLQPQEPAYRSPYTGGVDDTLFQALLNNAKRSGNWGYPEGQQNDYGFINEILARYEGVQGAMPGAPVTPAPFAPGGSGQITPGMLRRG